MTLYVKSNLALRMLGVDICWEVSLLSSNLALPYEGHMDAVFHVFGHLDRHQNAKMVFDSLTPCSKWISPIARIGQLLSLDLFLAKKCRTTCPKYVYLDSQCDPLLLMRIKLLTSSLVALALAGFLVYLKDAPIYWTSKKQISVEMSSFGSECTAMKQCTKCVRGLRYKLKMMGIPSEGPTYVLSP
jgi:hypothetical protein